ncbi:MAG: glycosyltransferase family 9 protein [Verrucomicrobiota bacterium]
MKRIILCRPDRVGDTIISSSCFQPLNAAGHTVYFMARQMMSPLFENHPLLEGFIPLPNSPHPTQAEKKSILQRVREVNADMFIHLHPLPALYPLIAQTGIPIRIGHIHKGLTKHLTHAYPYLKQKGFQHEAYYNFDLIESLDLEFSDNPHYSIHLNPEDEEPLHHLLPWNPDHTSYIVLNPTAHSLALRWPVSHFIELAEMIREHFVDPFVIIGDNADDPSVKQLLKASVFEHFTVNLAGKTSLGSLGWLLKKARMLVGRNTGPSHLAAAVECPTVEIFGRMEPIYGPSRWHALGEDNTTISAETRKRWFETKQKFWKRSYESITPQQVFDASLPILERS